MYTRATIVRNKMGHLHVWKGCHKITQVDKYNYHNAKGEESTLYFQRDEDIDAIIEALPTKTRNALERFGYVLTEKFPSDYFPDATSTPRTIV